MSFGPLQVINNDTIAAGKGFGMNHHLWGRRCQTVAISQADLRLIT